MNDFLKKNQLKIYLRIFASFYLLLNNFYLILCNFFIDFEV
jgi:hypothetical protein